MSGSYLDTIVADVRAARGRRRPAAQPTVPDPARRRRFVEALSSRGLSVIAELKRRSPSAGAIAAEDDLVARARAYAEGGANALSILTESNHFGGAPRDLVAAGAAGLPRLRKDFLLETEDVDDSLHMGADAILLIAAVLEDGPLRALRARARSLGLAVLVEAHDERELERALAIDADAVGLNARDLRSFAVDLSRVERLLPTIPAGTLRVAESGVRSADDARRLAEAGADAILVGESLMRAEDPAARLRDLRGVRRG